MNKKVKKQKEPLIPRYAVLPLLSCVGVNFVVYFGLSRLADSWKHYDFTLPFDRAVPVMPAFVSIYLGCYIFWFVNYIMIARQGKKHCMRLATADMMSRIFCGIFFLLLPTTNVRPELSGGGFWVAALQKVYEMDQATNLFPSIHCLVSWYCYIGLRGRKNVPKFYRAFSCIFAVLVFVSTQVTKQHYIVDVIGAVVIAELTYYLAWRTGWYLQVEKFFDRISGFIFGRSALEDRKVSKM